MSSFYAQAYEYQDETQKSYVSHHEAELILDQRNNLNPF